MVTDAGFARLVSPVHEITGVLHRIGMHADNVLVVMSGEVDGLQFLVFNLQ